MVKIELELPEELVESLDAYKSTLDYPTRGEFILSAVKRLVDNYRIFMGGSE